MLQLLIRSEWYSWHFPELVKIVNDNILYARLAKLIGDRGSLVADAKTLEALNKVTSDEAVSNTILTAAKTSMGYDISEFDLRLVNKFVPSRAFIYPPRFAARVVSLAEFRAKLSVYLRTKMSVVAPNLSALIGDVVGARLINHAGYLFTFRALIFKVSNYLGEIPCVYCPNFGRRKGFV